MSDPLDMRQNVCGLCNESFEAPVLLVKHIRSDHQNLKDVKRVRSVRSSYNAAHSLDSVSVSDNDVSAVSDTNGDSGQKRKYICNLCGRVVNCPDHLRFHLTDAHKIKEEKSLKELIEIISNSLEIVCGFCQVKFATAYLLRKHIEKQHPNNQLSSVVKNDDDVEIRPNVCGLCDTSFPSGEALKSHIRDNHTKSTRFVNVNAKKPSLAKVVTTTAKTGVTTIRKSYSYLGRLQPNPCGLCKKIFTSLEALDTHMKKEHLRAGKSKGISLLKSSQQKPPPTTITNIVKMPTVENSSSFDMRPNVCGLCNESFLVAGALLDHIKAVHQSNGVSKESELAGNSEIPLKQLSRGASKCHVCRNGFANTKELNLHNWTYHPKKMLYGDLNQRYVSFECHNCQKSFNLTPQLMRKHIKSCCPESSDGSVKKKIKLESDTGNKDTAEETDFVDVSSFLTTEIKQEPKDPDIDGLEYEYNTDPLMRTEPISVKQEKSDQD